VVVLGNQNPSVGRVAVALAVLCLLTATPGRAEVVLRDPVGRVFHLRPTAGDHWQVSDAHGAAVPGAKARVDAGRNEVVLELDVRTGREVGLYTLLRGGKELGGRRLRVRANARVLRLVMIAPPPRFEEPAQHLADFGIPVVASLEGATPAALAGVTASVAIAKNGTVLCQTELVGGGSGFFRGRFMDRSDTPCGDRLLEQGGGAYVVRVSVEGEGVSRADERAVFIPEDVARLALRTVIGPLPVAMRANTTPPAAIRQRERYYASASVRGVEQLEPASIGVAAEIFRNGILWRVFSNAPELRTLGAGNYAVELSGDRTAELGQYSITFRVTGNTRRGQLPYETGARLFDYAIRSEEPPVSESVYFDLASATLEAELNAKRGVDVERVKRVVRERMAGGGDCRVDLFGYASRDAATARAVRYDLVLSGERAKAVRAWLAADGTVLPGAFAEVRGLGQFWESQSESEETRAKNRRVMINVYCK
jgi:outer membrane protein OmpA-like peptidoglycan-associated protein